MEWPVNREQMEYMKKLQYEARVLSMSNVGDNWADAILATGTLKWTRKAIWGCRLFDLWNGRKGVALEFALLSKNCGLIPAPEIGPRCDKGRFPWHRRCENHKNVWSPHEVCC